MRVEDRFTAEAARQSSATAEAQATRRGAAAPAGTAQGDRLQLSGLAERIRTVFEGAAAAHAGRVAEVAGQVHAGTYRVDTAALSRALAAEAF